MEQKNDSGREEANKPSKIKRVRRPSATRRPRQQLHASEASDQKKLTEADLLEHRRGQLKADRFVASNCPMTAEGLGLLCTHISNVGHTDGARPSLYYTLRFFEDAKCDPEPFFDWLLLHEAYTDEDIRTRVVPLYCVTSRNTAPPA